MVRKFEALSTITMTILSFYSIEYINLMAAFIFLPVSKVTIPPGTKLCKKQGKIVLPAWLNHPDTIISMRHNKLCRGIVRSAKPETFLHSIIIDIGTELRIISLKLTKGSIELTGPTSIEMALASTRAVLGKLVRCQEMIDNMRTNRHLLTQIYDQVNTTELIPAAKEYTYAITHAAGTDFCTAAEALAKHQIQINEKNFSELVVRNEMYYFNQFCDFIFNWRMFADFGSFKDFFAFLLAFVDQRELRIYSGSLEILKCESEMVNVAFNLGYPIKQTALAAVMNSAPFTCSFNTFRDASCVTIYYNFLKEGRTKSASIKSPNAPTSTPATGPSTPQSESEATGKKVGGKGKKSKNEGLVPGRKPAKQTICVSGTGYTKLSGPSLTAMEPVYYAFMHKVLNNEHLFRTKNSKIVKLTIKPNSFAMTPTQFKAALLQMEEFRQKVKRGDVPMAAPVDIEAGLKIVGISSAGTVVTATATSSAPSDSEDANLKIAPVPSALTTLTAQNVATTMRQIVFVSNDDYLSMDTDQSVLGFK